MQYKVTKYAIIDGIFPSGRGGSTMITYKDKVILFGGHFLLEEGKYSYLNEVWVFTPSNGLWKLKKCKGIYPSERYAHCCNIIDNKMIIFGGKSATVTLNDVHVLDLDKWTWLSLPIEGKSPRSRYVIATILTIFYYFSTSI